MIRHQRIKLKIYLKLKVFERISFLGNTLGDIDVDFTIKQMIHVTNQKGFKVLFTLLMFMSYLVYLHGVLGLDVKVSN